MSDKKIVPLRPQDLSPYVMVSNALEELKDMKYAVLVAIDAKGQVTTWDSHMPVEIWSTISMHIQSICLNLIHENMMRQP